MLPVLLDIAYIVDEINGGTPTRQNATKASAAPLSTAGSSSWPAASGAVNTRRFLTHWRGRVARTTAGTRLRRTAASVDSGHQDARLAILARAGRRVRTLPWSPCGSSGASVGNRAPSHGGASGGVLSSASDDDGGRFKRDARAAQVLLSCARGSGGFLVSCSWDAAPAIRLMPVRLRRPPQRRDHRRSRRTASHSPHWATSTDPFNGFLAPAFRGCKGQGGPTQQRRGGRFLSDSGRDAVVPGPRVAGNRFRDHRGSSGVEHHDLRWSWLERSFTGDDRASAVLLRPR